ncbi:MAG: hypothetical protein GXX84_18220 [Acidobacteria bacterium]|nr:hypothetical protein [Acidobacteriota bacterium]
MAKAAAKTKAKEKPANRAKAPASEKREYKTPESAAKQKLQWESKGYKVTRRGNILHIKKG